MADFAIVQDDTVVNVVVAEDEATAAMVTGMNVVPVVDGVPGMAWTLKPEGWRPPSPFPSWTWNGTRWDAPVPYPGDAGAYVWDEEKGAWVEYVSPEPEPAPGE